MNDADVQGFGAIRGVGVEMVVTLGTGCGTAIFDDGRVMPHLELSHHPVRGKKTYDEYVGRAALEEIGKKKWNRRVARVIDVLRTVVAFDHLYIGGGNAKHIKLDLPDDVSIVPNSVRADRRVRAVARASMRRAWRKTRGFPGHEPHGDRVNAAHPGRVRGARGRLRLPCACLRHGGAVSVRRRRGYTPPPASADELAALLRALRLSRVVIVQPSVYGTDNSCTLDGMRRLGPARARGVAVIGDDDLGRRTRRDAPGRHPRRAGSISKPPARATRIWRGACSPTRWRGSRGAAGMSRSIRGWRSSRR